MPGRPELEAEGARDAGGSEDCAAGCPFLRRHDSRAPGQPPSHARAGGVRSPPAGTPEPRRVAAERVQPAFAGAEEQAQVAHRGAPRGSGAVRDDVDEGQPPARMQLSRDACEQLDRPPLAEQVDDVGNQREVVGAAELVQEGVTGQAVRDCGAQWVGRPGSTANPRSFAAAAASPARRVLPMPASPEIDTTPTLPGCLWTSPLRRSPTRCGSARPVFQPTASGSPLALALGKRPHPRHCGGPPAMAGCHLEPSGFERAATPWLCGKLDNWHIVQLNRTNAPLAGA